MGTEARLQSYAHAHAEITKQVKNGWKIKDLSKGIEDFFKEDNKVATLEAWTGDKSQHIVTLQYIPVSRDLKSIASRISNYLHVSTYKVTRDEKWWALLRDLTRQGISELAIPAHSTLLGPPLLKPGSDENILKIEMRKNDPRVDAMEIMKDPNLRFSFVVTYTDIETFYAHNRFRFAL